MKGGLSKGVPLYLQVVVVFCLGLVVVVLGGGGGGEVGAL